ncbi:MAG: PDZ domain-containing protein [Oscillospiraceae bacterium]|nr:PDZ domain-containing protein [Oscillospiraceae bacterium]
MKDKLNKFLSRKIYMDSAITACLATFLGAIALMLVWLTVLAGGWKPLVNSFKFMQLQSVIDRVYVGEADSEAISDLAFATMIDALEDRWSYYMTAEEYEQYRQEKTNNYVGIGITLQKTENGWHIFAVAKDSPAEKAGIVADTYLVEVNGLRLTDEDVSQVAEMMREEPDHVSVVIADRDGNETAFELSMEKIYSNPVHFEMMNEIGYIKIDNFDDTMAEEAIAAVDTLIADGAQGLVFDVRNNGGGYLTELCELLDYLLPAGEIFVSVDECGKEKITTSDAKCIDLPMAVLVNEHSYSAAEFFAAALCEFDAAEIVGSPTTGKNRSQTNVVLIDGSAVHISSKRYLTPNRVDLTEQGGLMPDLVVEDGENDPQLAAALETVRKNLTNIS